MMPTSAKDCFKKTMYVFEGDAESTTVEEVWKGARSWKGMEEAVGVKSEDGLRGREEVVKIKSEDDL